MRYRIKDYNITIGGENVYVHIKVPNEDFLVVNPVKEAIRLIVDETAKVVFCSSMQKDSIASVTTSSVSGYDVAIGFAIPDGKTIASTDQFTIEMDWGDSLSDLQGSDATVTLTAIYEYLAGQTPEDIPEGLGDRINLLLQFFGLTQAQPEYTALTDAEVIACCRDEQYNVMGDAWPIPAWLPDGLTEQDIHTAATALGITYHAPTETPSES